MADDAQDRRDPLVPLSPGAAMAVITYRNYTTYKRFWKLFVTGFLEPVFYLFSIGIGVGQLIDSFQFNGQTIPYPDFVAPGMLAASAVNGALMAQPYTVFFILTSDTTDAQIPAPPQPPTARA